MSGYTIIDADTHVTETPDLWTSRAPASMRDRVPHVVTSSDGTQRWVVGPGKPMANVGMTATAGVGSFKHPPKNYEEHASWRIRCQARDSSTWTKWASGRWSCIPTSVASARSSSSSSNDPELMLTCVQIYNDWQTEWASADSRRLLPITSIPFWDVAAAVKEVRRCATMGHKGILFTGEPQYYGKPLLGRSALESVVGGGGRIRSAHQLPHRVG